MEDQFAPRTKPPNSESGPFFVTLASGWALVHHGCRRNKILDRREGKMGHRCLAAVFTVMGVVAVTPLSAPAQSTHPTAPRTPWGAPDLQGVWTLPVHHAHGTTRRAGGQRVLD